MAPKVEHKYAVAGGAKSNVLDFLAELQAMPQHKWIPIEEMTESNRATLTPRQATWIETQVAKRVEGRTIELTAVPQPAEVATE